MEDIYTFVLDSQEFEKVLEGKKTAHLKINNPKLKVYAVGTQIKFVRKVAEGEVFDKMEQLAVVENLLYFGDVKEAIETVGKERCGFRPSATFEKTSDLFLADASYENMEKYGIVAIIFKNID